MFDSLHIASVLGVASPPSKRDIARYMMGRPLDHTPGTVDAYSNFGYMLLGLIIEQVTRKSYVDYIQQDLLRPIGIAATEIQLGRSVPAARNPREPWYSDPNRGASVFNPGTTVPSPDGAWCIETMDAHGGMIGSARALALFLKSYWISGEPRQGIWNGQGWTFFGSLPGTTSMVRQRSDGISLVALFNQRQDSSGSEYSSALWTTLNAAANSITQWPDVAQPDEATTSEDTPLIAKVLANDTDSAGNALRVVRVDTSTSTHGTVSINADGTLRFVPEANFNGTSTWSYAMSDGTLVTSALVTVQVRPVNDVPIAAADTYTTGGTLQVLAASGVLKNDTDADGQALTAILKSPPSHGTLALRADGSFDYRSSAGLWERDTFTYAASDGQAQSTPVQVTLTTQESPDVTAPSVSITAGAPALSQRLALVSGLAADPTSVRGVRVSASGIESVSVHLRRNGLYWNGRAWQGPAFALRTILGTAGRWQLATALPPRTLAPDGSYSWTAIARDKAGNHSSATQMVQVDATAPTLVIETPQAGSDNIARVVSLSGVSGRTSGATKAEVALRRADGFYWNGRI